MQNVKCPAHTHNSPCPRGAEYATINIRTEYGASGLGKAGDILTAGRLKRVRNTGGLRKSVIALAALGTAMAGNAWGAIDETVVNRAWSNIARADNFKEVKINYEKDDAPNAWVKFESSEKFSVHVTKGLMKILNHEAEIAGVLGHEIGHVRCGHYNSGVQRNVGWAVLGSLLGKAGGLAQAAGTIGMNLAESGFSREQEVEADDYGTDLLYKAGYSPWGLYHAMKSFKDNGFETAPSGFNSHPPTERRLTHLRDRAKKLQPEDPIASAQADPKAQVSSVASGEKKPDTAARDTRTTTTNKGRIVRRRK